MYRALLFSLMLALGAVAQPSYADPVRLPATGDPAFAFDAPPGSTIKYDQQGDVQFFSPDHATYVQLTMFSGPSVATMTTADMAADILKAAGVQPYSRTGTGEIAGHAGDAFYADLTLNGVHINVEVVIVRLDAAHAAISSVLKRDNLLPAQTETLAALLAAIRLTAPPAPN